MNKTPMERWRKWRATHERTQVSRWNSAAYRRRVEAGKCGHCSAVHPPGYEYATCEACRKKCKLAQEQRRAAEDLECVDIDEPAPSELVRCSRCSLVEPHECMKVDATDRRPW